MLTHSLVNMPNDLPGLTLFADFWLQTMFDDNPASSRAIWGVLRI